MVDSGTLSLDCSLRIPYSLLPIATVLGAHIRLSFLVFDSASFTL